MATIRMTRYEPVHPGGPDTADVQPAEVEGMEAHGWKALEADPDPDPEIEPVPEPEPEPEPQSAPELPESTPFDVDTASKAELEDFAGTRFGVTLDKRKRVDSLRDEVRGLIDGG